MNLTLVTTPRCKDCGQFIKHEFSESPFCDGCMDRRWDEFMEGADEELRW